MEIFYAGHVGCDTCNHFAIFVDTFFLHSLSKKGKTSIFLQKWLAPTSHDVISPNLWQNVSKEYVHSC